MFHCNIRIRSNVYSRYSYSFECIPRIFVFVRMSNYDIRIRSKVNFEYSKTFECLKSFRTHALGSQTLWPLGCFIIPCLDVLHTNARLYNTRIATRSAPSLSLTSQFAPLSLFCACCFPADTSIGAQERSRHAHTECFRCF